MKIYLLVDNETGKTVDIYKYEDVALLDRNRTSGFTDAIKNMMYGDKKDRYRVEVMEVIE